MDKHLELKEMVEERAAVGRKTLGAWLHHCREEVGDIGVGTFKMMSSLVDSTIYCMEPRSGGV